MDWAYKLRAIALAVLLLPLLTNASEANLSWTPPTQNDDGTPLNDLASYEIWSGCSQTGTYADVEIVLAPATSHTVTGLADTGTCYFAAKATNSVGISSVFSNEASKLMAQVSVPGAVTDIAITWAESQALIISNTLPGSYEWGTLAVGELVYIDRGYIFTSIPNELVGLDYLRTANDDKTGSGALFTVNKPVTVFLAHDVRISTMPAWLTSWIDTGLIVVTDDTSFDVYSKDFPAGSIMLGGNQGDGFSMYGVIVRANRNIF